MLKHRQPPPEHPDPVREGDQGHLDVGVHLLQGGGYALHHLDRGGREIVRVMVRDA